MIICLGTTPAAARSMVFDRLTLDDVNRAAEVHESAAGKSITFSFFDVGDCTVLTGGSCTG